MAAMSDYLENKLIDSLFRGQTYTPPTSLYVGLLNTAPSDTGGGTEVSAGGYARVQVSSSLANWAGTQAAGSTGASTGNTATTSNNAVISFPTPTANWSDSTNPTRYVGIYDAATGGNLLFYATLLIPKVINQDDSISFTAGQLSFQLDT